jgi:hypothetical protein
MAEEARGRGAVNPDCPNADNPFHRCAAYCPVAAPAPAANKPPPAQNGTARGDGGAGGRPLGQAVNPDCPNADNPFHRCAEYCPVPAPAPTAAKIFPLPPGPGRELVAQNGRAHSDGDLKPRERRRDRAGGGSGGLPLYVFRKQPANPPSLLFPSPIRVVIAVGTCSYLRK